MKNIIVVGTGPMAIDYVSVLKYIKCNLTVIGRGETSAENFKNKTGITPITGGIKNFLTKTSLSLDTSAIIATGTEALLPTTLLLLKAGVNTILVEKPAAISIEELIENEDELSPYLDKIFIAYNRRFYASVLEAQKLIEEDGGLKSMHFEFTEWAHKIEPLKKAAGVKENWFFANSTHVVDLAFYLAGKPSNWSTFSQSGELKWHPKTNFSGAGITDKNVVFSYISNWESAGRWAIELLTFKRRIYLKPMEKIAVQQKGSIQVVQHDIDFSLDEKFKPGLYKQVQAFVSGNEDCLLNMKDHINNTKTIYSDILK